MALATGSLDYGGKLEKEQEFFDSDEEPDYESSGSSGDDYEPEEDPEDDLIAESRIEGDFDRLLANIRGDEGQDMLSKEWDFASAGKEEEFRDDLRAASGIGKKKKRKGGRQQGPVLSPHVSALIGEGNQAYVDSDIPETIRIMHEVIRIEPRAASAWSVLAQCHEDVGEAQKALQLRIMAAHLRHDAEEWDRLARQSKELGYNQQALYCFGKLYNLDPSNADALWDRAALAKETGDLHTARKSLFAILKRYPHDLTTLDELRPILIDLGDLALCATLFQAAFDHYQLVYPTGVSTELVPEEGLEVDEDAPAPPEPGVPGGGFGLMEILVLADLYNTLSSHESAVVTIRRGCRWLGGRLEQAFWDVCEDDREYDIYVEDNDDASAPGTTLAREGDLMPGCYPLDVNARHRLAVARIKLGDEDEGKQHASIVLEQDMLDYAPLFTELADAWFEREIYTEAKEIYERLGRDEATSSLYVLIQVAACLREVLDLNGAAEVYEQVRTADPSDNDSKMKLAEIYEILNEPRKALELVYEVIDSRRVAHRKGGDGEKQTATPTSLFDEKARAKAKAAARNRLTRVQVQALEAEREKDTLHGWKRIQELWPQILSRDTQDEDAVREWLLEVEKMVEGFRETRNLFTTTKGQGFRGMFPAKRKATKRDSEADEDNMASRLQLDMERGKLRATSEEPVDVEIFRGISFDDWLKIIMQYAFLLAQRDQYALADEVLRHVLLSKAYSGRASQDTIRFALITIAVSARKYEVVVEHSRKLINAYQFNNEPYRILTASISSGLHATDAFIQSTLTKHLYRELKLSDAAVHNPETMRWKSVSRRWVATGRAQEDDEGEKEDAVVGTGVQPNLPTVDNPCLVAVYGQICVAAKSYQSAIFYLLHAYDYCPDDPMICLSLAIASIGRAMQRQSDNRHHLITQAMAFLTRYRSLRGIDSKGMDEIEFNFARAFHHLGLHSLAVKHYERVLALAEGKPEEEWGLAREAAYNLSLILVMTGANPLAQAVYRKWLSI